VSPMAILCPGDPSNPSGGMNRSTVVDTFCQSLGMGHQGHPQQPSYFIRTKTLTSILHPIQLILS
jgi:hypothetical protein